MKKYITIPGFTRYRINIKTMEVQSCCKRGPNSMHGKWHTIKPQPQSGAVGMHPDENKADFARYKPERILWAAINGTDVRDIGDDIIVTAINGKLQALHRDEFNAELRRRISLNKRFSTPQNVEQAFTERIEMLCKLREAYKTGKYNPIITEYIMPLKEAVTKRYAVKYNCSPDFVNELWSNVLILAIERLLAGAVVTNMKMFLYSLCDQIRKQSRALKQKNIQDIKYYTRYGFD